MQLHGLPADRRVLGGQGQAAQGVDAHAPVPDPAQDLVPHRRRQRDLGSAHTDVGAALDDAFRGTLWRSGGLRGWGEAGGWASLASTAGGARVWAKAEEISPKVRQAQPSPAGQGARWQPPTEHTGITPRSMNPHQVTRSRICWRAS